jgi:hypothetical protein
MAKQEGNVWMLVSTEKKKNLCQAHVKLDLVELEFFFPLKKILIEVVVNLQNN